MNKLSGLLVGLALAVSAPVASAAPDSLRLHPTIGGAEMTFAEMADQRGIDAPPDTSEFWYAGTGGWPSE